MVTGLRNRKTAKFLPYSRQLDDYLITVVPLTNTAGKIDGVSLQVRDLNTGRVVAGKALGKIIAVIEAHNGPYTAGLLNVLRKFTAGKR